MEMIDKIRIAAGKASQLCHGKKNINRVKIFRDLLTEQGIESEYVGEKPAKGMSFFTMQLKDRYRVNVRCGYGRHNYAPCVEIKK